MTSIERCPVAAGTDFTDPDTIQSGVPLPAFATLRQNRPLYWNPQTQEDTGYTDGGFWLATRHEDVKAISCARSCRVVVRGEHGDRPLRRGHWSPTNGPCSARCSGVPLDGPHHTKVRGIVSVASSRRGRGGQDRGRGASARRPRGSSPRPRPRAPVTSCSTWRRSSRSRPSPTSWASPGGPPPDLRVVELDDGLGGPRLRGRPAGGRSRDPGLRRHHRRGAQGVPHGRHHLAGPTWPAPTRTSSRPRSSPGSC